MPELPEVEIVRMQLTKKIIGKTIKKVEVFHDKTVAFDTEIHKRLKRKSFASIDRIGKLLIFSFINEPDLFLLAHLKMTGQFFYIDSAGIVGGGHTLSKKDVERFPGPHTRTAFYFTDKSVLYFNDMRLFGYTKLANQREVERVRSGFGPEPISADFDCRWFSTSLRKKQTTVKAALLNQAFIAGLGNIYVDEALWRAHIRPERRSNTLTNKEALLLCVSAGDVMKESIKAGGTTFQHFLDTDGEKGNFTSNLQVFGKQGVPCPCCGEIIQKNRVAGRGTHFCPHCQK